MTIFDLTFKQFLIVSIFAITLIIVKVWFFPEHPKELKEKRIQKTVRILDKKWDKWIKKNE